MNIYGNTRSFCLASSIFLAVFYLPLMGMLGCSGCGDGVVQAPQTPEVSRQQRSDVPAMVQRTPLQTEPFLQPPDPEELSVERLMRQKHPSLMNETELELLFVEAVEVAETDRAEAHRLMHKIAADLGRDDPDWTEYLHLLGHTLIDTPLSSEGLFLPLDDALRFFEMKLKLYGENDTVRKQIESTRMKIQWNADGEELSRRIQPIEKLLSWMKEHAQDEWEIINPLYQEKLQERVLASAPRNFLTDWLTPEQRADIRYETFFEALEHLALDSTTLQVLYQSTYETAQESLLSEQATIQSELPPPEPSQTPTHTWDFIHEIPIPSDADKASAGVRVSESAPPVLSPQTLQRPQFSFEDERFPNIESFEITLREHFSVEQFSHERFQGAIKTLSQYGPEEGLRRLKKTDAALAEQIEKYFNPRESYEK